MLHAQEARRVAPKLPPRNPGGAVHEPAESAADPWDEQVFLPALKGIVLCGSVQAAASEAPHREGVQFVGEGFTLREPLAAGLSSFLRQPVSLGSINRVSREIAAIYRRHDRPVVDVVVAEQDITAGYLKLIVIESRFGAVRVQGNRWFSTRLLESGVRLQPGDPLLNSRVEADLDWINTNPFRSASLIYTPGEAFGTTDIIVETRDRFPARLYTGIQRTGNSYIGEMQGFAGFNLGNVLGLDHRLNYQFSSSNPYEAFHAHSLSYEAPLSWRHTLQLFGSMGRTEAETVPELVSTGESLQASFRYTAWLPRFERIRHGVYLGGDFKRANNNLEFGSAQVFDNSIETIQGTLGYQLERAGVGSTSALDLGITWSPGNLTNANTDAAFEASRAGAQSNYWLARASAEHLQSLPWRFSLAGRCALQLSSERLPPGEQFASAGYTGARGYDEGIGRGDSGLFYSLELRSPELRPLSMLRKRLRDSLQLALFFEQGIARTVEPLPGEHLQDQFASWGAGIRYRAWENLSVDFSYAIPLTDDAAENGTAYLSVLLSF